MRNHPDTSERDPMGWVRVGFFALVPAAIVGGALALAPLIGLAGFLSARMSLIRQMLEKRPLPLVLLGAFVAWALVSAAWSSFTGYQGLRVTLTLLPGLMLAAAGAANQRAARLTLAAAAAAFVVAGVLLGVEAFFDLPINRAADPDETLTWMLERFPGRGSTVFIAMTWGVAGWLISRERGSWLSVLALLAGGVMAFQFSHLANATSFVVGALAFAAALAFPRLTLLAITAGLAFWLLTAPFLTPILFADTSFTEGQHIGWISRVEIWRYTSAHILEAPLFGHGLDSARTVSEIIMVRGEPMRAIPLHPHSAVLQIWYELGAVGALLAASALVSGGLFLARAFENNRAAAAASAGALASTGVIACVGYGLWQEWWIATMCISAAIIAAVARSAKA